MFPLCCVVSFPEFSNYYNLFSLFFAVFMAFLFVVSFCYVMYSVAVAREMKIMLYSACESSAE